MNDTDFVFEEKWLIHAITDACFTKLSYGEVWLDRIFHRQIVFCAPRDKWQTLFTCTIFDRWTGTIHTEIHDEYQSVLVVRRIDDDE